MSPAACNSTYQSKCLGGQSLLAHKILKRPTWVIACRERRMSVLFVRGYREKSCFLSDAMKRRVFKSEIVVDIASQRTTPRGSYRFSPPPPTMIPNTAFGPHLVKWQARCGMSNGSRTIGAAISSDHLLAPSRQLAMHGIVRKLDVPRRNRVGVLYVGSPSRAGVQ
jgi:hypothetical protein